MAEIEILLGTRNGARHLGAQLASFTRQTFTNWQLCVSDDGSTDGTRAVLGQFTAKEPRRTIRIIEGPRLGAAANYLHLLQRADPNASFVALSDQDDVWFEEKLARGIAAIRTDRPVIYAAGSRLIDQFGKPIVKRDSPPPLPSFGNALVQNVFAGNTIILNKPAVTLARRALPAICPPFHDWWLYALMTGAGAQLVFDPKPVLAYRQHQNSVLGAHAGLAARTMRASLLLDGTWRRWLRDHHAALASVEGFLLSRHRKSLAAISAQSGNLMRFQALMRAGARRQATIGTAILGVAALTGYA